ncbi:cell adhesion molecule Dscam1-like isoform X2 [Tachypleus tridentatus]|uniref:cell adhesion molecule Dscam1-like isoform X2 n=1 Tax=Tachypleus tridentatus TaxID=6853 RepID=UPI003FD64FA0
MFFELLMMASNDRQRTRRPLCLWIWLLPVVSCQVIPEVTPFLEDVRLHRGQRYQLTCSASQGSPPLTFQWLKDGVALRDTSQITIRRLDVFSSMLVIEAVREEYAGNYTCVVSNSAGEDTYMTQLHVLVPPRWIREPYDVSGVVGQSVTLECNVGGFPIPTVSWTRTQGFTSDEKMTVLRKHWRVTENGDLITRNLEKDDRGFYTCEAFNGVGEGVRKTVRLEVQVPPAIQPIPSVVTVTREESIRLTCNVTGDRPLIVSWKKDGISLGSSSHRVQMSELSTVGGVLLELSLDESRRTDSEPPGPPENLNAINVWSRTIRVTWSPSYSGRSPVIRYILQYWKGGSNSKSRLIESRIPSPQTMTLIRNLLPARTYHIQVLAENEVGVGKPSSVITVVTQHEAPTGRPKDLVVYEKGATYIKLKWMFDPGADAYLDITAFYVGYRPTGSSHPYVYHQAAVVKGKNTGILSDLQRSTSYSVVVRAFNSAGLGVLSDQLVVHTARGELPAKPSVHLLSTQASSLRLRIWIMGKEEGDVTAYIMHLRRAGAEWFEFPLTVSSSNVYTVGGLTSSVQYQLYITAQNKWGESGPSDVITCKTQSESSTYFLTLDSNGVKLFTKLSVIIPVSVSVVLVIVVPITACCLIQKINSRPFPRREGIETRDFIYTPGPSNRPDIVASSLTRRSPPRPCQSPYSRLTMYGSEFSDDPRYDTVMEEIRAFVENNRRTT